jgi:hypothetical protein
MRERLRDGNALDTRLKIVDSLPEDGPARLVVTGYFDPLLASHARRLEELAAEHDRLTVAVLEPGEPLLPQRARAELVAALKSVKTVLIGTVPLVARFIRLEDEDERRRAELVDLVRERHSSA